MIETPPSLEGFSAPIQVHGTPAAGIKESVIWGSAASAMGSVLVLFGIVGPTMPQHRMAGYAAIGLGILVLLVGLMFWLNLWWLRHRRIWLFPEGFVDSFRGKHKTCRWEEIVEMAYYATIADLSVRKENGKQLSFGLTTIDRAGELAECIAERATEVLSARLAERIRRGETVNFGRIDADSIGLTIHFKAYRPGLKHSFYQGPWPQGERRASLAKGSAEDTVHVPWDELEGLEENGECDLFLITSSGALPLFCSPGDVPNVTALVPIAQRLGKVAP